MPEPASPGAHLWVKIDLGHERQVGPGKIAVLRLIGEQRSIAAAARDMKMSYRRAWLLIESFDAITRRTEEAVRDELAELAAEVRA